MVSGEQFVECGRSDSAAEDGGSPPSSASATVVDFDEARRQAQAQRKKCRKRLTESGPAARFGDVYQLTGELLGQGACAAVHTAVNRHSGVEVAVKIIDKFPGYPRLHVFKEIDTFYHCRNHPNIIQLVEYIEEEDRFYLVFEKVRGGQLLDRIRDRRHFSEAEACSVIKDLASGLQHLHGKGIAHRDLKPENILCVNPDTITPVKICDFDLGSGVQFIPNEHIPITTPQLHTPVGSADFMAPEVVEAFFSDHDFCSVYDKRCDLWSLGVIMYILLCGYPPFYGNCGQVCGWERGEVCMHCRDLLFHNIHRGVFEFPEREWRHISADAKNLIGCLLVKEPLKRLSADMVLHHAWVEREGAGGAHHLTTPGVMQSSACSLHELSMYAQSAMAVNRTMHQHLSSSDDPPLRHRPVRHRRRHVAVADLDDDATRIPLSSTSFGTCQRQGCTQPVAASARVCVDGGESDGADDDPPFFGLTPPLESTLMQRRLTHHAQMVIASPSG